MALNSLSTDGDAEMAALRARIAELEAEVASLRGNVDEVGLPAGKKAILEQLVEGVIVADIAGRIRFVNSAAAHIHGVESLDVDLADYSAAYHLLTEAGEDFPSLDLPLARAVLHGETIKEARWLIARPDGRLVRASGNAMPLVDREGRQIGAVLTVRDETARIEAEHEAQLSRERLTQALQAARMIVWDLSPEDDRLTHSADIIRNVDEMLTTRSAFARIIHPDDRDRVNAAVHEAVMSGQDYRAQYRVLLNDGHWRWVLSVGRPRIEHGKRQMSGVMLDITEEVEAKERQQLLTGELNHRVKNMLAIVQSLALQSRRGSTTLEAFTDNFIGRIMALSTAHNLLTRESWQGAMLADIALDSLRAFQAPGDSLRAAQPSSGETRVEVAGPPIRLASTVAVNLAMALHELATNALKYGALSVHSGRVRLHWHVEGGEVRLLWREQGGPPVTPPARRGFGLRLIEQGVTRELGGRASLSFAPDGVRAELVLPVSERVQPL